MKQDSRAAFNRKWKRFLFSRANLALLDGYGWNDGGCWILAQALLQWASPNHQLTLTGLWAEPGKRSHRPILHHLFVTTPGKELCIDGDGVLTSADMLNVKPQDELIAGKVYLQPISDVRIVGGYFIESDPDTVHELAIRLKARFGDFQMAFSGFI
ncbi:MAG: hypothetical protein IM613_20795 [Cytophagales bacterium]|nr:hypothetical protein [Cytophagales bacterium]